MKLCRIGLPGSERPAIVDSAGKLRDVSSVIGDITPQTIESCLKKISVLDIDALPVIEPPFRYGPPVGLIGKMICIGLNYRRHAEEAGMALPSEPIFFLKATSAICGPDDDVILPHEAEKGDWEIELGVVIGKPAQYVAETDAMDYVAGYCIVNDISERAFQLERGSQWTKGKSSDTFGPVGPWLVTADEVENPHDLPMQLYLNGQLMQDGRSDDLIYDIPRLISHLSRYFTLHPGDVIATGTPSGVGMGLKPQRFLRSGDIMRASIEGLGQQQQQVVSYSARSRSS